MPFSDRKTDGARRPGSFGHSSSDGEVTIEPSRVLVVAKSPVNRVVVCKIVENCGLKTIPETPEGAAEILTRLVPGIVVLDGGPDNKDCDALIGRIEALRRTSGAYPAVILLSIRNDPSGGFDLPAVINAVVVKPITPEALQPVITRLSGMKRS